MEGGPLYKVHSITPYVTLDVTLSTLLWLTGYCMMCAHDRWWYGCAGRSCEWLVRQLTFIHACLVVMLSAWCGFMQGPWPFTDPGGANTYLQYVTCLLCLGYFIFDFLWCLYFQTEAMIMLIHHILSIFGTAMVVYEGRFGTEMIAVIFGAEFTNPLLQTRWFLHKLDLHLTWYGELNDFLFIVSFGVMRLVIGSYLLYCYLRHPLPTLLTKLGGFVFYMVGWIFYYYITDYAIRKYRKIYKNYRSNKSLQNGTASLANGVQDTFNSCNSSDKHSDEANGVIKQLI